MHKNIFKAKWWKEGTAAKQTNIKTHKIKTNLIIDHLWMRLVKVKTQTQSNCYNLTMLINQDKIWGQFWVGANNKSVVCKLAMKLEVQKVKTHLKASIFSNLKILLKMMIFQEKKTKIFMRKFHNFHKFLHLSQQILLITVFL